MDAVAHSLGHGGNVGLPEELLKSGLLLDLERSVSFSNHQLVSF